MRRQRLARGLSLTEVARRVGCARSYLSLIETGRRDAPNAALVERLERTLRFRPGALAGLAEESALPEPVRERLRSLEHQGDLARRLAEIVAEWRPAPAQRPRAEDAQRLARELLGDAPIARPTLTIDDLARARPSARSSFVVRLPDDSMAPDYRAGDVVAFDPSLTPQDARDCLVRFDGAPGALFRRVFIEPDGALRLQPLDVRLPPRRITREAVLACHPARALHRWVGPGADPGA